MTVVAQINVESRRYNGYLDPRYPIGYWQAALSLIGDASGGFLEIDLLFQTANGVDRLNSQMYSCERLAAGTDDGFVRVVAIQAVNMGGPSNQGFQQRYTVTLNTPAGVAVSSVQMGDLTMLPWFLGSQRTPGLVTSLALIAQNTDLATYTFEAEGYRWDARSVLVDGGPQRPPTGLYRA